MSKCYTNSLEFVFDEDGHTKAVCTYDKRPMSHEKGRKICPHHNGKCPAIEQLEKK